MGIVDINTLLNEIRETVRVRRAAGVYQPDPLTSKEDPTCP